MFPVGRFRSHCKPRRWLDNGRVYAGPRFVLADGDRSKTRQNSDYTKCVFFPIQTMHIRVTSERTSVLRLLKQVLDQLSRPRRSPRDLTLSSWSDLEGFSIVQMSRSV